MGLVSGKTASQDSGLTPKYSVLGAGTGYEVRAYEPYVVAEVQGGAEAGAEDDRFRTLAKYIGVFGSPENKAAGGDAPEAISMTAPVVVGSPSPDPGTKISMTTPVVVTPDATSTMQFIMPTTFTSISDLPTPTDKRVSLREVPERIYLVRRFSGNMGSASAHDAAIERQRAIVEEGAKIDGGAFSGFVTVDSKVLVARYNPPWTLPFLKTNELWFPLPLSRDEAIAKLPSDETAST